MRTQKSTRTATAGLSTNAWRNFRHDKRGVTAIITALSMPVIIGAAGMAIDVGVWRVEQSRLQMAADVAAVSAAKFLSNPSVNTAGLQSIVETTISDMTQGAMIGSTPSVNVVVAPNRGSITVTLNNQSDTYFSKFFLNKGVPMSAIAGAGTTAGTQTNTACILAIGKGSNVVGIDVENEGSITATNCAVFSNSNATVACTQQGAPSTAGSIYVRNGSISASFVGAVGTVCANTWNGATSISPSGQSNQAVESDWIAERELEKPENESCTQYPQGWSNGGVLNLSPGTYCGDLTVDNGMTVNFAPGVYNIQNGNLIITGGAKINEASGVTFYLGGSNPGSVQIENDAQSAWTMSAPSTVPTAGILFWQDAGPNGVSPTNIITGSGGATVDGAVYMPYAELSIINRAKLTYPTDSNGNPTGFMSVIANTINLASSGSGVLNAGGTSPQSTNMVLTQ